MELVDIRSIRSPPAAFRSFFLPTFFGLFFEQMALDYFDGVSTQTITQFAQGTGINAAFLTLMPNTFTPNSWVSFGPIAMGGSSTQTFTVANAGTQNATSISLANSLVAPFSWTGGSYPGTGGNCTTTLASGQQCTISVTYTASSTSATWDSVSLNYFDSVQTKNVVRSIVGWGVYLASLSITPNPADFGLIEVGESTPLTLTLANSGLGSATSLAYSAGLNAPFSWLGGTYPGTGGTCGASLAPGANCTLVVIFSPSAKPFHTNLILSYFNQISTNSIFHPLQGQGILGVSWIGGIASPLRAG